MKNILIALCCLVSLGVISLHAESFENPENRQAMRKSLLGQGESSVAPRRFVALNFNAPLHRAGQKPMTGSGPQMPAGLSGNPQVVAATPVLPHQPLVLNTEIGNGPCCYEEGIQVLIPEESDQYVISFDLASQQLGRSSSQFQLWLNDGPAPLLIFRSDNLLVLDSVGAIASFKDNHLLHVQVLLDLPAGLVQIAINGESLYQGPLVLEYLHSLQFMMTIEGGATPDQVDPQASVALDNIVVANAGYRYANLHSTLQRSDRERPPAGQIETLARVHNISGHAAQDLVLTHLLPAGTQVKQMHSDTLDCEARIDQVLCQAEFLGAMEQASVYLLLEGAEAGQALDITLIATSSSDEIDNRDNQARGHFAGSSTLLGLIALLGLWLGRRTAGTR